MRAIKVPDDLIRTFLDRYPRFRNEADDLRGGAWLEMVRADQDFDRAPKAYLSRHHIQYHRVETYLRRFGERRIRDRRRLRQGAFSLEEHDRGAEHPGFHAADCRLEIEPRLRRLHPTQLQLIRMMYWRRMSLEQASKRLPFTRSRAGQIHLKALARMRASHAKPVFKRPIRIDGTRYLARPRPGPYKHHNRKKRAELPMSITTFDKGVLSRLGDEIEAAVQAVAQKHGISIKRGRGKYDRQACSLTLEISTIAADGTVQSREAAEFKRYASLFGFRPEDLGRSFKSNGKTFTIAGVNPKGRVRPVLATGDDGKTYTFRPEDVRRLLAPLPEALGEITT